jgi:hypothetical protein
MARRWISKDVYIYERKFFGSVVLVAINKSETIATNIIGLNTALPAGTYSDYLTGLLGGSAITITSSTGGSNSVNNFIMPAQSVGVWQFTEGPAGPETGSIGPAKGQPGVKVTIGGRNFGSTPGSVKFGATAAAIVSWSPKQIVCTTPAVGNGVHDVTVTNSSNQISNGIQYTVLTAKLIPVKFTIYNATPPKVGEYIFLTGDTVELGQWSATWDGAVGPMLAPDYHNWFLSVSVPAGQTIHFKFIKIAASGALTSEASRNYEYTVPTSGTGHVDLNWQY